MRQTRAVWPERVARGVDCDRDQRWIFPSPPLEARFTLSAETVVPGRVAPGYQDNPPTRSVWPRKVFVSSRLGTERSFTPPPQFPAAMVSPLGLKREMLTGRSPAIWEPKREKLERRSLRALRCFMCVRSGMVDSTFWVAIRALAFGKEYRAIALLASSSSCIPSV